MKYKTFISLKRKCKPFRHLKLKVFLPPISSLSHPIPPTCYLSTISFLGSGTATLLVLVANGLSEFDVFRKTEFKWHLNNYCRRSFVTLQLISTSKSPTHRPPLIVSFLLLGELLLLFNSSWVARHKRGDYSDWPAV